MSMVIYYHNVLSYRYYHPALLATYITYSNITIGNTFATSNTINNQSLFKYYYFVCLNLLGYMQIYTRINVLLSYKSPIAIIYH